MATAIESISTEALAEALLQRAEFQMASTATERRLAEALDAWLLESLRICRTDR